MTASIRIGILTGGGDVPGLNAVIRAFVYRATETDGYELVGIRRGWRGLTHLRWDSEPDPQLPMVLNRHNTRSIDRTGGTFLRSSRTNPGRIALEALPEPVRSLCGTSDAQGLVDATPVVLDNLSHLKLDGLIVIGGDDTLSYASRLADEGVRVVAVPKTMDNDVRGTELCVGFSTAITRAVEIISRLRTTLGSHERIGIFRMFGRDAGFTVLHSAYVTGVRCAIPEYEFDMDRMIRLLTEDRQANPGGYAMVLLSEGAHWHGYQVEENGKADAYGHRHKQSVAEAFAYEWSKRSDIETIVADLTYELRSGEPDTVDRTLAITFGNLAFEMIADGACGRMAAIHGGCYIDAPIPDPVLGSRQVDVGAVYDCDRLRPRYANQRGVPLMVSGP